MLLALFLTHRDSSTHTRLAEEQEQHTVVAVVAAAHTRLAEEREQHTVAVVVAAAVARQRPPPQVSSSSVNIPINAPRGKRGNVARDHTTLPNRSRDHTPSDPAPSAVFL